MKEIALTQGYVAIVDDADFEAVNQFKWCVRVDKPRSPFSRIRIYAKRVYVAPDGRASTIGMHRFILGITDPKLTVDHRDGDGLNNRRGNLRVATRQQNIWNQKRQPNRKTFKGVTFSKRDQRWIAGIGVNHKHIYLGRFPTEVQAAEAYDVAARQLHGEFACLNFADAPSTNVPATVN